MTMCSPSGNQSGSRRLCFDSTATDVPDPSANISISFEPAQPAFARANAIFVPSADQAGSEFGILLSVKRVRSVPFGAIVKIWSETGRTRSARSAAPRPSP